MSRCFSYPPPYFKESLIDLIKLQEEKEKAKAKLEKKQKKKEKKERRKEENKEKKENKEKGEDTNQDPKYLLPKEQNQWKRKFEESPHLKSKSQSYTKKNNDGNELFEGSGVTEELESPCSIQRNCESSESSQDIAKKRKLPAPVLCNDNKGSILRFKLLVSRPEVSGLTSLPVTGKKDSVENSSMPVNRQRIPEPLPVSVVRHTNRQAKGEEQPNTSKRKRKFEVTGAISEPHSRTKVARIINSKEPAPYLSTVGLKDSISKPWLLPVTGQKGIEMNHAPSSLSGQKNPKHIGKPKLVLKVDCACLKTEPQPHTNMLSTRPRESELVEGRKSLVQHKHLAPTVREKTKEQKTVLLPVAGHKCHKALDLRSKSEIKEAAGPGEQPCFSGRITTAAQKVKLPTSSGSRSYEELFLNWKPLPLCLNSSDNCDEDWMFGGSKGQSNSSVNRCNFNAIEPRSVSGGVSCTAFLQPRASYMPELSMFILPYAIPF